MKPAAPGRGTLRFDGLDLDREARELRRDGRVLRLPRQQAELLAILAERPGEVVTREELRHQLWGDHTHVDFDRGLNFCMSRLRATLRDPARSPRLIQTVPGRGYRFLAHVERCPSTGPRPRGRRPWAMVAALAVALASAASALRGGAVPALSGDSLDRLLDAGRSDLRRGLAGLPRAIRLFDEALRREPRSAGARAALAHAYVELGRLGGLPPEQAFPAARTLAFSALAIDDVSRAHLVLGEVAFFYDWDEAGAELAFRRALAREPESPLNLALYAQHLSAFGRHSEALAAIGQANRLAPSLPWVLEESARCHYRARRFTEAAAQWGRALQAGAAPATSHWGRMLAYRQLGRIGESAREARAVLTSSGASSLEVTELDGVQPGRAVEWLIERRVALLQGRDKEHPQPEQVAYALAALGEGDRALEWLEKAVATRAPYLLPVLASPEFDRLRRHPRFPRLAG